MARKKLSGKSGSPIAAPPAPKEPPQPRGGDAAPYAIVGVGASAGGIEAFTSLIEHIPPDTGMAFVMVLHLPPTHISMLAEIIARHTSMKVCEVQDEPRVKANHVYVIPPARTMVISGGSLSLTPRADGPHHPIDLFFSSLAADLGHRAIGVVLSGTASDGTVGLTAIKENGGITFAQDASAKHDGMPRSAIAAGVVDFVMPPSLIAHEIVRIANDPYVAEQADAYAELPEGVQQVIAQLRHSHGVDFSQYKSNTLHRRIRRRMVLLKLVTVEDYALYLQSRPQELEALYQDILISVTRFFRNPEAFEALRNTVFPGLFRDRSRQDPIRLWALGCSTGEEPYSLAIALTEYAHEIRANAQIIIYATDLNGVSIDKCRAGLYPKNITQDISPERLRRFFVEADGGYRINKAIRDMCIFARHNALSDPPFSRMDLISCRNVMIYMESTLQRKLMPVLHYALKPNGHLLLGPSETVGPNRELFEIEDTKHKIYSKKPVALRLEQSFPLAPYAPARSERAGEQWRDTVRDPQADLQREAERVLLSNFVPAGVLVSSSLEVLQFRGDTGAYLSPAPGKASLNVLKMAREGLLVSLRALLQKARREDALTREQGVMVKCNGGYQEITLSVIPVGRGGPGERCYWVLFDAGKAPAPQAGPKQRQRTAEHADTPAENDAQIGKLTSELAATRDYLQSVIEQQEAANEELQSANEEVQSANEELQSINEELETSKEEIQSSNEELTTVNEELHNRNDELNRANNDLNNLFSSVQMAIVMVWQDLRIRRFTPMAEKLFNLIPTDIGRPIGDIKLNLEVPDLPQLLGEVIDSVAVRELEVQDRQRHWYLLRVRPYKTFDNKIDGAVIVLVDIDSLRQSQEALERRVRELAAADRHKNEFLAMLAHELRNPLAPLRNAVQIMKSPNADRDALEAARELMARQVGTLSRLVDDLLDAARVNRGQVQLRKDLTELQSILMQAADGVRAAFEARGQHFSMLMPPTAVFMECDAMRLEQVFGNLLGNAAKYTRPGGEISLSAALEHSRASAAPAEVVIRVRDNGIGIAEDMLPRVFDLFTQADQSLARTEGGLGIGLSVVRSLVELHGGRVEAHSRGLGHGSEFVVYLPTSQASPPRAGKADRGTAGVPATEASGNPQASPVRVLVVDDNVDIAESTAMLLSLTGYSVRTASSGEAAVTVAAEFQPSAVLLDIGMPGMNGYEVCRRLRQQPGLESTAVIAVTGYGASDARAHAIEAGFDHYLLKPVEPFALEALLRLPTESHPSGASKFKAANATGAAR